VRLWQWLREQLDPPTRTTILPPEPFAGVTEQVDLAIERTRSETRRLVLDGGDPTHTSSSSTTRPCSSTRRRRRSANGSARPCGSSSARR
jgi:hypothetical protein